MGIYISRFFLVRRISQKATIKFLIGKKCEQTVIVPVKSQIQLKTKMLLYSRVELSF